MFEGFPDHSPGPTSIGEIVRTTQAAQLIHHAAQESLADDLITAALANAGIPAHVREAHDRQIARLESKPITVSATLRIDPETGALRILSADSDITAKLRALGPTIQVQITL